MVLILSVFGLLFICMSSILIYFIYDIFSINKVTNLLNPIEKSIWNNINITIIPMLLWYFICIPAFGKNNLFILMVILCTCVASAVMYIIKYGLLLFNKKDSNFINVLAIIVSTIISQLLSFLLLNINSNYNFNIFYSIIFVILYLCFVIYLKLYPPKTFFFTEKK